MVGRMLLYGWRFMLGQRVPNEQSNVGQTKYVAVGPTLNQRLGFGWRMVILLAGEGHWQKYRALRKAVQTQTRKAHWDYLNGLLDPAEDRH